jgi:hypothetical protein
MSPANLSFVSRMGFATSIPLICMVNTSKVI